MVSSRFDSARIVWSVATRDTAGHGEEFRGEHLVSSMPIRELVPGSQPGVRLDEVRTAQPLRYRDFDFRNCLLGETDGQQNRS